MRVVKLFAIASLSLAAPAHVLTQAPQTSAATVVAAAPGPTYEVVSIKRNTTNALGSNVNQRPDGGFMMVNIRATNLITMAYPQATPMEIAGIPEWARTEGYDVSATSTLSAVTPDQRTTMLRAMLADRFKLIVHFEDREQPVFDLVVDRSDGRLGSGLTPLTVDCSTPPPANPTRPDFAAPPPPCTTRVVNSVLRDRAGDKQGKLGDLLEGETTMANLARGLSMYARRAVVDKTNLSGSYRVKMNFDGGWSQRPGLDPAQPAPDAPPAVFTAVQEQLGLKLESSRAPRETLVIDRLERPTEN